MTVYLSFDPCEAMGANALNTVLEAITPVIERITEQAGLMSILSNYATEAIVKARCEVPIISLHADVIQAETIARQITLASDYAKIDPFRATTHGAGQRASVRISSSFYHFTFHQCVHPYLCILHSLFVTDAIGGFENMGSIFIGKLLLCQ